MKYALQHDSSGMARLMGGAPGYAVGWQQPIYVPAPAAGANWSHKVDGRYFERLLTVTFVVATDAVVANRVPLVQLLDGNGTVVTAVPAGGTVVASSSLQSYLAVNNPVLAGAASGGSFGFLPDLLVPPDWTWRSQVAGLDVADQISGVVLLVQQFPNDAAMIQVD